MTKLLLRIHDYLTAHRLLAIASLLVLLALGMVLALQRQGEPEELNAPFRIL